MDLSVFDGAAKAFDEGFEVDIVHPTTGKKLGMKVRVASYQSQRVRDVQRRLANANIRDQKRNPKKVQTVEEIEDRAIDVMVAAVLSWEGFERGGKAIECTTENVRAVLTNPDLWFIAEQIDAAADNQLAFVKASPAT
ncbi:MULTISPECIES: hypothetical protein [Brucella]|uniref:Uncharacterized protein n=1 Tax=Brucella anthropi TaxID=529 RepID=A0A8I0N8M3_BRUAN|nr:MULTISPECIES: hypothetical protein [Brucella/Ochrobactrum group]MBE0563583.1 hypothetical protein [Brucella anthropi]MBM6397919.1 hypothetical protein [Brucella anthropi]MCR8490940.1 hypothetical protein [Brucella anthropi]WGG60520.1 hypothetical protein QA414_06335 [Brucella intermedia]